LTSCTMTEMVSKSEPGGEPLSVTRIVITFVEGPWASAGVHVNTPLEG
jgi:hypothetical protein